MHRQYANSQRKTRSGGKNGGRRPRGEPKLPAGYVHAFPSTPEQRAALDAARIQTSAFIVKYEDEPERVMVPIEDL